MDSSYLFLSVSFPFHTQWQDQMHTHTETCAYRSVWSLLIIRGFPHGRQMALLIFQTDTAFWYLIWSDDYCVFVSVCVYVCAWFPRMNSINLSSEGPCCLLWVVCACMLIRPLVVFNLFYHHKTVVDGWPGLVKPSQYFWTWFYLFLGHVIYSSIS